MFFAVGDGDGDGDVWDGDVWDGDGVRLKFLKAQKVGWCIYCGESAILS